MKSPVPSREQEQTWKEADPALVGILGQQMGAGNANLSSAVSCSAGWVSWTNNFIVWKWGSPFPQDMCPRLYLLTLSSMGILPRQQLGSFIQLS